MPEFVPCDLCGADEYEVLNDKAERERQGILQSVVIRDGDGHILNGRNVICKHCGLVYVNPRMTREELDHFYRHDYRKIYGEKVDYTAEKRHAETAKAILDQAGVRSGALLDIGCSTGKLLQAWPWNAFGIEPNERNCKIAREAGLRVENVTIEEYAPGRKFDVVVMLNALEHVLSPKAVLAKVASLLADGGYLLVSVPHLFNKVIHIPVDAFLSNAHLYQFDPPVLFRYFQEAGLKLMGSAVYIEEIGEKVYFLGQKTDIIEPVNVFQDANKVTLLRKHLEKARQVWEMKLQIAEWGFR